MWCTASPFFDGDTIGLAELAELGDILSPPSEASVMALTEMLETSISSPISTGPELEDPKGQKRDEETTISVRPIGAQKVDSALTGTKHTAQEATKDSWLKK